MESSRLSPDDWPRALADTDGRQIVVAGPGTGKTEFLVRRVAHLVETGTARPDQIMVLSFSRRATGRLAARIEEALGARGIPVDVSTFHSVALRLLEASSGGDRPIPLTTPEQVGLVRGILAAEDPGNWPLTYRGILDSHVFAAEVADFLLRCSERLLTPDDLAARARERADWRGLPGLYSRYLAELNQSGRSDYGVLLTRAVDLLTSPAGAELVGGLRYVLVDEYQDTTPAQATMAELLARSSSNLTVAGDPYQSIFSFRGAELRNIAAFAAGKDTRRWVLAQSFRVPQEIMTAALRVVAGGDLPGSAGPVQAAAHHGSCEAFIFDQETAEAEWIAAEAEHLVRVGGINPSRIAVVVRSKKDFISELSRALERRSLPHDSPNSRLVDHPAVRIFSDLVAASLHDGDDPSTDPVGAHEADRAMRRVLLGPLVGVSVGLERHMLRDRRRGPRPWSVVVADNLPDHPGLGALLADSTWVTNHGAADGFWLAWTRLDGVAGLINDPARAEWRRAWTAFSQMLARQAERDPQVTLQRFFELVDEEDFEATPLLSHQAPEERINLTTLHQAKGQEFDVVFIANAVEGVFPDLRRSRRMLRPELLSPERMADPDAQHLFQIQEEMRLAYTAMTRARLRVVWTATDAGVDQGEQRPSRFLFAAAGDHRLGPPRNADRDPLTVTEAEARLRRDLLDPAAGLAYRLAAARVLGSPARPWWDPGFFAGAVTPGPDSPVLTGPFRLSPSQADVYERCPRRYVMERRLRLGDATSVWAHFGELAHDVLERAEGEVIGTGKHHAELKRVLLIVDEVWENADFGTPELNESWRRKAVEMFTKLYERWPGKGEPVGVELDVEADVEGVTWLGRIDRLERLGDGLRVVDYKTGTRVPTKDEAAVSIQLGFYAHAAAKDQGEVTAAEMWFPRAATKGVSTRQLAMHQLPEVEQRMRAITASIGEEKWEPRVSGDCNRCGFRRSCPAWPEGKGAFLP